MNLEDDIWKRFKNRQGIKSQKLILREGREIAIISFHSNSDRISTSVQ